MTWTLRPLTDGDLPLLAEWRARPHVAARWGDPDPVDELASELLSGQVAAYVGVLDGRDAAFVQVYRVMGSGDGWWPDEKDPGARGIDLFLADEADLGRGLGTELVRAVLDHLFADPAVSRVQADPAPDNHRAIATFFGAGMEHAGEVATPDGPARLLVCTRRTWEHAHLFRDAAVTADGRTFTLPAAEARATYNAGNYWHGPGDPSTWLAVAVFQLARGRVGDAGTDAALPLAAAALGITPDTLRDRIEWHEQYMRFHDGDPDYHVL